MSFQNQYLLSVYQAVCQRNAGEPEFLQSVQEVLESLDSVVNKRPDLVAAGILERLVEPERMIQFRVSWVDDKGAVRVNRGWRVQYSSAIGPYKGGLRLHPSVNGSILKFLAFEQTLKNALTGLPIGGAKGGADFNSKDKSEGEVMRFCQSFATELTKHIGADTDVPAGDIGAGSREIGYMFGQYKRLSNEFTGAFTGKSLYAGGSWVRKEATGYGLCYFVQEMLSYIKQDSLERKTVVISGSGNVAIYASEKAAQLGAKVVAMSDSNGYIYDENGINLAVMKQIKEVERGRIQLYAERVPGAVYTPGCDEIWSVKCDVALPCATQNEINSKHAQQLVNNGVTVIAEGANMPCTPEAIEIFRSNHVLFCPGKACNAGGVAVSSLEMCQNSVRYSWSFEEVDAKLKDIMACMFHNAYQASEEFDHKGDLVIGANIAGFLKVAEAMKWQGVAY